MNIRRWIVGGGEVANFRDESEYRARAGGDALVLLSEGRPTLTWSAWVPTSLWLPLRGTARVVGHDLRVDLAADQVFIAEQGNRLTVQAGQAQAASLVGVLLPPERILALARAELGDRVEEPLIFPEVITGDPSLQLPLLRLAHSVLRDDGADATASRLLDDLILRLLRRQADYSALIDRCPGRSRRYRRQVFMRLLRARTHIESALGQCETSLARLAAVARMSPTHFLRLYRDCFGQTPHKHVVQTRLAAAREMLLSTELGVAEICRTLGFENRCAFARVFKQHFGQSPTATRGVGRAERQRAALQPAPFFPSDGVVDV
jgi:AraC family transcriptional regulator